MPQPAPLLDAHAMWRVLVDALTHQPDSTLVDEEHWVQLRTPSSSLPNHNAVLRARLSEADADRRIDEVLADHAARGAGLRWVVDEGSSPADLSERLEARGLPGIGRAVGMVRAVEGPPYDELPAGIQLVRVTEAECDLLGEITAAAWERSAAFGDYLAAVAKRSLASEASNLAFWIALDGDVPVGSSQLRLLPSLGYLQGAAVLPSARGRGIYRALTWVRIAEIHRRGLSRVVIWADPETSGPVARRLGFQPVTEASFFEQYVEDR